MNPEKLKTFRDKCLTEMKRASAEAIAKRADFHICATRPYLPGSAQGQCTICGAIVWYADLQAANLQKVCLDCALEIETFLGAEFVALRTPRWDVHKGN